MFSAFRNFFLFFLALFGVALGLLLIPIQLLFRSISPKYTLCYYFYQTAVAADELVGSLFFGSQYTVSAIMGNKAYRGHKIASFIVKYIIDGLFGKNHSVACAIDEGLISSEIREYFPYKSPEICNVPFGFKVFTFFALALVAILFSAFYHDLYYFLVSHYGQYFR